MSNKPKTEIQPYNNWTDATAPDQVFTYEEMMKRLKEAHGIDTKSTKGTRKMIYHIDGDTWFSYTYEWEINGMKFGQHTRCNRRGSNLHQWSGE